MYVFVLHWNVNPIYNKGNSFAISRMEQSFPNTRPIRKMETKPNSRGRVYQCQRCVIEKYEGERSKVLTHFYCKHVALDAVPFYCSICKFVTTSQRDLENHVLPKYYPSRVATVNTMLANGETVNENSSLLQNLQYYIPTEKDIVRLSKCDSDRIFLSRQKPSCSIKSCYTPPSNVDFSNDASMELGKEDDASSQKTVNILDDMLGNNQQTPLSLNRPIPAPRKSPVVVNDTFYDSTSESSSSSSSSSSNGRNSRLSKEVAFLRKEIKTMGAAMAQMVSELDNKKMDKKNH